MISALIEIDEVAEGDVAVTCVRFLGIPIYRERRNKDTDDETPRIGFQQIDSGGIDLMNEEDDDDRGR